MYPHVKQFETLSFEARQAAILRAELRAAGAERARKRRRLRALLSARPAAA